jgi:hypothetical protein
MANGINHAKKIVIDEAEQLSKELQNGHSGDPHTQGRAIALIVKMITPLYTADFVTKEECFAQHDVLRAGKVVKLKAGPFCFEGSISPALTLVFVMLAGLGIILYATGKAKGWF